MLESRFNEIHAQLSPNGRWLAYASDEAGPYNVYVTSFPELGPPLRISSNGGTQPLWRGDGQELYFWGLDNSLMAAPMKAEGDIAAFGTAVSLFRANPNSMGRDPFRSYGVAPDGQRFLVNSGGGRSTMSVLLDWTTAAREPANQ